MNNPRLRRIIVITIVAAVIGAALGALNSVDARLLGGLVGALIGGSIGFVLGAFPRAIGILLLALLAIVVGAALMTVAVSAIVVILEAFGVESDLALLVASAVVGGLVALFLIRRFASIWQRRSTADAS